MQERKCLTEADAKISLLEINRVIVRKKRLIVQFHNVMVLQRQIYLCCMFSWVNFFVNFMERFHHCYL